MDTNDAIRAKDDVLNRLGGNIGMVNGQTVRIGFGKADSAPATPPSGAASNAALGAANAASGAAGNNQAQNASGPGGMDAQLQSTPTRALWIGSIPSTTTPATILSVFSPYGPIESARVLTHKNCGFSAFFFFLIVSHLRLEFDFLKIICTQSILRDWTMRFVLARLSTVAMFSEAKLELSESDSPKCLSRPG